MKTPAISVYCCKKNNQHKKGHECIILQLKSLNILLTFQGWLLIAPTTSDPRSGLVPGLYPREVLYFSGGVYLITWLSTIYKTKNTETHQVCISVHVIKFSAVFQLQTNFNHQDTSIKLLYLTLRFIYLSNQQPVS